MRDGRNAGRRLRTVGPLLDLTRSCQGRAFVCRRGIRGLDRSGRHDRGLHSSGSRRRHGDRALISRINSVQSRRTFFATAPSSDLGSGMRTATVGGDASRGVTTGSTVLSLLSGFNGGLGVGCTRWWNRAFSLASAARRPAGLSCLCPWRLRRSDWRDHLEMAADTHGGLAGCGLVHVARIQTG